VRAFSTRRISIYVPKDTKDKETTQRDGSALVEKAYCHQEIIGDREEDLTTRPCIPSALGDGTGPSGSVGHAAGVGRHVASLWVRGTRGTVES